MTVKHVAAALLAGAMALGAQAPYPEQAEWRQWGGPERNFHVEAGPLAATWPEGGPPVLWERPLGLGHSAIVVDDGRLHLPVVHEPVRLMFTNGIRIGNHLYGTSGDFGPAFFGALDIRTGEVAWQERGFSRANLVHADGKLVILDEDGQLALAEVSATGLNRLASTKLFTTTAWTVPTLVGTTLYARDRERIVALSLGTP